MHKEKRNDSPFRRKDIWISGESLFFSSLVERPEQIKPQTLCPLPNLMFRERRISSRVGSEQLWGGLNGIPNGPFHTPAAGN